MPDNVSCCLYYQTGIEPTKEGAHTAAIGDKQFDEEMKNRLRAFLDICYPVKNPKAESVLEVMAGPGRNYEVWIWFFKNVEMIEQSPVMA